MVRGCGGGDNDESAWAGADSRSSCVSSPHQRAAAVDWRAAAGCCTAAARTPIYAHCGQHTLAWAARPACGWSGPFSAPEGRPVAGLTAGGPRGQVGRGLQQGWAAGGRVALAYLVERSARLQRGRCSTG
jgi:hypothetical protein